MKEVKEWNGKPRWMWVWDAVEECKKKDYVICILTESEMKECEALYPVKTIISNYSHCAEIEEVPKDHTIRYKQGEWEEPTKETVWKWWGEETPDSDIARDKE